MHDKDKNIGLIAIVLSLGLLVLTFLFGVSGLHDRRLAVASSAKAVSDLTTKLNSLKTQKEKLAASDNKVQNILLAYPKNENIPDLLVTLEGIASASGGVKFTTLSPAEPKIENGVTKIPVNIAFDASYDQFKKVIDLFNHSLRPFSVEVVNLASTESGVSVSLQVTAFSQQFGGKSPSASETNPTKTK